MCAPEECWFPGQAQLGRGFVWILHTAAPLPYLVRSWPCWAWASSVRGSPPHCPGLPGPPACRDWLPGAHSEAWLPCLELLLLLRRWHVLSLPWAFCWRQALARSCACQQLVLRRACCGAAPTLGCCHQHHHSPCHRGHAARLDRQCRWCCQPQQAAGVRLLLLLPCKAAAGAAGQRMVSFTYLTHLRAHPCRLCRAVDSFGVVYGRMRTPASSCHGFSPRVHTLAGICAGDFNPRRITSAAWGMQRGRRDGGCCATPRLGSSCVEVEFDCKKLDTTWWRAWERQKHESLF